MNFYRFQDIHDAKCCLRFVKEVLVSRGYKLQSGNRIQALWRNGDTFNIAVNDDGFYDHVRKEKGSVIRLCALAIFGGDGRLEIQQAQEYVGKWLGLTPAIIPARRTFDHRESPRYRELLTEGFAEAAAYRYTDRDGNVCFTVYRMERTLPDGSRKKDFVQCSPFAPSIRDAAKHLYNLPAIVASSWCIVVEGEKDADTLIRLGLPATTCNNGAANWRKEYTEELRGKEVVVCRDNDHAGEEHQRIVLAALAHSAASLRAICPSTLPKGDVTDWIERENGSAKRLLEIIKAAPDISPEEALSAPEQLVLDKARAANRTPFSNYAIVEKVRGSRTVSVKSPRSVAELVDDFNVRFLGFPLRLGERALFDHDRDTERINFLEDRNDLFAWISDKSKQNYEWQSGSGFVSRDEFFAAIFRRAKRYEKIASVPVYPFRADTYLTFRGEYAPSRNHEAFETLMRFFAPATRADALLIRTLFAAPLYYRDGIQRPCWIIDSVDAQEVGKSTLVEILALLYRDCPIKVNLSQRLDEAEVTKRIVSQSGRNARICLFDNVRGVFSSPFIASLITSSGISGRAPFGHGEETRPNDLTYIVTSNSANVDTDIATRSFYIYLRRPGKIPHWESNVRSFVEEHRVEILGDIIDTLKTSPAPRNFVGRTRASVFEAEVMYPMCGSIDAYKEALSRVLLARDDTDIENERAVKIGEILRENMTQTMGGESVDIDNYCVFVRAEVVKFWLDLAGLKSVSYQDVRNYINTNALPDYSKSTKRYPRSHRESAVSGILFIGSKVRPEEVVLVHRIRLDTTHHKAERYGDGPLQDRKLGSEIAAMRQNIYDAESLNAAPATATALPATATPTATATATATALPATATATALPATDPTKPADAYAEALGLEAF